ncbi:PREDICTED: cytochrome P450 CYP12A2-like [Papilio xuthus]|uniref:Cytochrome P450 CYP12A2-like n=1 Tax=Papilio xuthus TaxID=66420 RepID=A0AAJ7E3U9_PAPXU|nr:PREDICTED: cytochrome P450 CYP12A2-like [Papilio xuthus]
MLTSKLRPVLNSVSLLNNARYVTSVTNVISDATESIQPLKSWDEIPGPSKLPIISTLHHFLPMGSFYKIGGYEFFDKLYKTYGPITRLPGFFGSPDVVILYDAESIAHILRSENLMPKRPGFQSLEHYRKEYKKKHGKVTHEMSGLATDHDENWKTLRSAVSPILLQPKTVKLYSNILDDVANDMIKRMRSIRDENNMLKSDLATEMNLWALESIGLVALGHRLNCFDPNLPADSPVRQLIQIVHDFFAVSDKLDFKPSFWRIFPTRSYKKAMKLYEDQENLSKYFIEIGTEALKNKKMDKESKNEKGILEKLLEINEHYAHLMASDLLFAGVDTTANTVIPTLYLLAKNPEKQNKLREEILSGSEKRPYLKACIKEAIRIMPVAVANFRQTSKEYNILGYHIPKHSMMTFAHQYLSMMECHYPRPNEYIPERWIADKEDPLYHGNAHPFAYMPFGFGSRSCIGRRIAELEIETLVTRVVENFQIDWFGEPLKQYQSSLNYVKGPFNFTFKDL